MLQRNPRRLAVVVCGAVVAAWLGSWVVGAAEPAKPWPFAPEKLRPFWLCDTMEGESVLFLREKPGEPARASLAMTPTRIVSVGNSSGEVVYQEGRAIAADLEEARRERAAQHRAARRQHLDRREPPGK